MSKEVLRAIAGIDIFPVISLVLFVAVFTTAVIRAMCLDRRLVEQLSWLPLDGAMALDGAQDSALDTSTPHSALGTPHSAPGTPTQHSALSTPDSALQ